MTSQTLGGRAHYPLSYEELMGSKAIYHILGFASKLRKHAALT